MAKFSLVAKSFALQSLLVFLCKLYPARFPYAAIAWLCIGLIQTIRWHQFGAAGVTCFIHWIPGILFSIPWVIDWLTPKKEARPRGVYIFRIVGLLSVGALAVITLPTELFFSALRGVSSPRKYAKILNEHRAYPYYNEILNHFPPKIPVKAKGVRFSYVPSFLQGGGHLQIAYKLPPADIESLYEEFSNIKTRSFPEKHGPESRIPTEFYTSGRRDTSFPAGFEVMALDEYFKSRPYNNDNHGRSHGVAIHRANHQIVYWAEWW